MMSCFKSCCQRSCCRKHKAKHFSKLYDSLGDSPLCVPPIDTEMLTMPYYQQPAEVCPQRKFQSSAPNAGSTSRIRSVDVGLHPGINRASPSLNISLHHDVQRCILVVGLLTISGLSVKNGQGIFLIATLLPLKELIIKSKVIPGSVHFAINQTLELPLERVHYQTLDISIFCATDADLLGKVSVVLEQLSISSSPTVHTFDISQRDKAVTTCEERGELMLSLCYNKQKASIQGILLKAKDLPIRASIMPDPYVQISSNFEETTRSMWRSTCKSRTVSPVYNESFCLDVSGIDLEHTLLQVDIIDRNRLLPNYFIGQVTIGYAAPSESGKRHWEAMRAHQGEDISYWHRLIAK